MDTWVASLVTMNGGRSPVHVVLGSSNEFSSMLNHVMSYRYSGDLDEWQSHVRRESLDPSSPVSLLMGEMSDGTSNGVNIFSSHKNTYVDFEKVKLVV